MNRNSSFEELYHRYLANDLSEKELRDFLLQLQEKEKEEKMGELMQSTWNQMYETGIKKKGKLAHISGRRNWLMIAAAIIVLVSVGSYVFTLKNKPVGQPNAETTARMEQRFKNDVAPGVNVPQLVLADGSKVTLDSNALGSLATQDGAKVTRLQNGEVVYNAVGKAGEVKYNTINNPRGSRVLPLKLVDGTKIWLDAASSITYPTAMVDKERRVTVTGQVYFEVAHNLSMPFKVKNANSNAEIEVLGTHFNVMAFDDEETMKVTLLEGSVKVSKDKDSKTIKPGEQAMVNGRSPITVQRPDLERTMAWKNGLFKFQDNIESLMLQLSRWYDVQVVYEARPKDEFVATISRDVPMSKLLKYLELTDRVHFKIEGKKITVTQ